MTQNPSGQPQSLTAEIHEIVKDLNEDLSESVDSFSSEATGLFRQCALELFSRGREPVDIIDDTARALAFCALIGREHARRGYQLPLHRQGNHALPDTIDEMFR